MIKDTVYIWCILVIGVNDYNNISILNTVPRKFNTMCNQFNSARSSALDEQRMIYMYQCFNVLMGLLDKHVNDNNPKVNDESLQQKAYLEYKKGNISLEQYQAIMDALMGLNNNPNNSYNADIINTDYNLNQIRNTLAYKLLQDKN